MLLQKQNPEEKKRMRNMNLKHILLLRCNVVKRSESESVSGSVGALCNLLDCSPPDSSVHGILQQEHWSGLPCCPPHQEKATGKG